VPGQNKPKLTPQQREELARRVVEAVKATVGRRAARGGFEMRHRDDIIQLASVKAQTTAEKFPDANLYVVAGGAVKQAVVDLWRSKFRRDGELKLALAEENARLPQGQKKSINVRLGENTEAAVLKEADEARRRRFAHYLAAAVQDEESARDQMHTSARFFRKEEHARATLIRWLLQAVQTEVKDRNLVHDAFSSDTPPLAVLARIHGVSKVAIHKRLNGHGEELKLFGPHFSDMDVRVLEAFCLTLDDEGPDMSLAELVRTAANYASAQATRSPEHKYVAAEITSDLSWIYRHLPTGRRKIDKICRTIVRGAAQYVILRNDAQDDMLHERGLWDDRKVVRAARGCVVSVLKVSSSKKRG